MTPPPASAAAPAVRARTLAPGRPLTSAPRPRRVSGPARGKRAPDARPTTTADGGLALGLASALQSISRHHLLDRLIRGRAWIGLVAFALLGIVTLQLTLLKLNAGIGRSLERGAVLQRENAALSIENSEMAAGNRVESTAVRLGMELVPSGALKFLAAHSKADIAHAASALSVPVQARSPASEASGPAAEETSETSTPASSTASEESTASTAGGSSTAESQASGTSEASGTSSTSGEPAASSAAPSSEAATRPRSAAETSLGSGETGPAGGTQASPTG